MYSDSLLKIQGLSVGYLSEQGLTIALDDISLDIPRGEIFSIVGESGCGKSTLASSIVGYVEYPAKLLSGSIKYQASDILSLDSESLRNLLMKKIAIVPQAAMNSLNPIIKVEQEIKDILKSHAGADYSEDLSHVKELLSYVGLSELVLSMYPHQLSGGMKQRVLIALSLLMDPEVVIMDEPTTGLDVVVQKSILDLVKKINQERGTTIVLVTHDLAVAKYVSSYMAIMYGGKVMELGKSSLVTSKPLHPYTTALISSLPDLSKRNSRLPTIRGSPIKVSVHQTLCTFRERCKQKFGACDIQVVEEVEKDSRKVLCLLYSGETNSESTREHVEEEIPGVEGKGASGFFRTHGDSTNESIELKDIVKVFSTRTSMSTKKRVVALNRASIKISTGEIRALVGASGSGKSTIANIIMGEFSPDSGSITIAGKEFKKDSEREKRKLRKMVQLVFQDPYSSLSPIHTVLYQILRPILINHKVGKEEGIKRTKSLLEAVNLLPPEAFLYKNPSELSGGQRQRVAIAKAIAVGAKFLVADEPVSMLDASVRAEILNLLKDLKSRFNLGILYITHDLSTVSYLADYIYVLKEGVVVEEGSTDRVLESPNDEYTKDLISAII